MNRLNCLIIFVLIVTSSGFSQGKELTELNFLLGTWQVEGKRSFESWEKKVNSLSGESYKLKNEVKKLSETIEIKFEGNHIVYAATVFNQNKGEAISFKLNKSGEVYSFENLEHDFPKKIQYKVINENKLFVSVLGKNDKGFSYHLLKK